MSLVSLRKLENPIATNRTKIYSSNIVACNSGKQQPIGLQQAPLQSAKNAEVSYLAVDMRSSSL